MILPNPKQKLFTYDIFPDDGETGNAMWGFHITNNFTRLYCVEFTNRFTLSFSNTQSALVDISKLDLHAAPIIQSWGAVTSGSVWECNPNWVSHELSGDFLKVRIHLRSYGPYEGYDAIVHTKVFGA